MPAMKKYKFSLAFLLLLIVTSPWHLKLERLILNNNLFRFVSYFMLAVIALLFGYAVLKSFWDKDGRGFAILILIGTLLSYFLVFRRIFLNRTFFADFMHIFEFFVLGFILRREGDKNAYLFKIFLLLAGAVAFELLQYFLPGRIFDLKDVFFNTIFAFSGFLLV
jgi:hypothetical protein